MEASVEKVLIENLDGLSQLGSIISLLVGSILLLMLGTFSVNQKVILLCYGLSIVLGVIFIPEENGLLFNGQIKLTEMASSIQRLAAVTGLSLLVFPKFRNKPFEYYFLLLSLILGSFFLTITNHLLLTYLAIELTSLSSYLLTSFSFTKKSFEASFKYLLVGVVSSALMIYGLSLLYGWYGTFYMEDFPVPVGVQIVGWMLFLSGLLFKTSVFPLHTWVPGTYQASPTTISLILSIVPKLCAFVAVANIMTLLDSYELNMVLLAFGGATLVLGTFAAIAQREVKRLISYGALVHSGFLLPLVVPPFHLQEYFHYYAVVYVIMNIGCFYFIAVLEKENNLELKNISGLGHDFPIFGASILVILIALVGLPPTAGFSIKLLLFSRIWEVFLESGNSLVIAYFAIGIMSTAVALYYYLQVPYQLFLKEKTNSTLDVSRSSVILTTFFAIALILIFIEPDILNNFEIIFGKP